MVITNFLYRYPSYLTKNDTTKLNSIAIHHTGNNNDIHVNTDYHIDKNGWQWLGYGFYIVDGVIYKVRGYDYQNAAVSDHNHHVVSIAVHGNYDRDIPSQNNMEALQWLVNYIKLKVPSIENIHGHNFWNDTTCPGRLFPIKTIKFDKVEYVTKQEFEEVKTELHKTSELMKRLAQDYNKDIKAIFAKLGIRPR